MKRRKLVAITSSTLFSTGCIERFDQGDRPTAATSPTDTDESTEGQASDCNTEQMVLLNDIPRKVSGELTVTETGSRYRGMDSPTATAAEDSTPEETPTVTFSDSFTLQKEENKYYEQLPMNDGRHILEVVIQDGPEGSYEISPDSFNSNKMISVALNEDKIHFSNPYDDPACTEE